MGRYLTVFLLHSWLIGLAVPTVRQEKLEEQQAKGKLPRVVGQAQTDEEFQAWMAVRRAPAEQRFALAEQFLQEFPESGLTGYAHRSLALSSQRARSYEKFIHHAEKSLEDFPNEPLMLTSLALYYAHRGEPGKAIDRGRKALRTFETVQRPDGITATEWLIQLANANLSLGISHLFNRDNLNQGLGDSEELKRAIEYLEEATELNPSLDTAYFHLGAIALEQNKPARAITNFARAAALDGIAATIARDQLQQLYKGAENPEKLIEDEREYVQRKLLEKQAKLQELEQQTASEESLLPIPSE